MAYPLSTKKRIRQSKTRNLRNRQYKSQMKTAIRRVDDAQNKEEALKFFTEAVSIIDTVAQKGIIHKNAAANKKSRLAKRVKRFIEIIKALKYNLASARFFVIKKKSNKRSKVIRDL